MLPKERFLPANEVRGPATDTIDDLRSAASVPSRGRKLISVVIPAYNEQDCVPELARRLRQVFRELAQYSFEVLIVDNGSNDATYERLLEVRKTDPRFKILRLSRNFHIDGGLTAGLAYAQGDAAVIMTADLQDPPELIKEFLTKWEEGYENVYGVVTERNGTGPIRRLNSQVFYWLLGKLTDNQIPRNASDFRLVDRRVYETVNRMGEHNRFLRGMFTWTGFKSIGIEHKRPPRYGGDSKAYTATVLEMALKGICANSFVPLRLMPVFGMGVSCLAFLVLMGLSVQFLLFGVPFPGFGVIVTVMLLMFGLLFIMLGIVSQYIGMIYEEVRGRPQYIVRNTVGL